MAIWRMRIACWIPKATDTHSEYVTLIALPLQKWSRERASILLNTYVHGMCCCTNKVDYNSPRFNCIPYSSCRYSETAQPLTLCCHHPVSLQTPSQNTFHRPSDSYHEDCSQQHTACKRRTIYRLCSVSVKLPLGFQLNTDSNTNETMQIFSTASQDAVLPPRSQTHKLPPPSPPPRTKRANSYDVTTNGVLQDITWRWQTASQVQTARHSINPLNAELTFWRRIFFSNFSTPCI